MIFKRKFNNSGANQKKLMIGITTVVICGIAVTGIWFGISKNILMKEQEKAIEREPQYIKVLLAKEAITSGEIIHPEQFRIEEVEKNEVSEDAVHDIEIISGQRVKRDLQQDEYLLTTDLINSKQWAEKDDRFVEHIFMDGAVPTTLPNGIVGTTVDIILFCQNAKDKVVVAKTIVVSADGNKLGFHLNDIERENLKEAAMEPGGLYLIAYLNDGQDASIVTYEPNY